MMIRQMILISTLLMPTGLLAKKAEINQLAPDFSLPDQDGKIHTLSDHKGKYVVLEWWNKDCPFVVKHYTSLDSPEKLGNMQSLQNLAAEIPVEAATKTAAKKEAVKKSGDKKETESRLIKEDVVWYTMLSSAPGKQGYLDGEAIKKVMKEVRGASHAVLRDPDGKVGKLYDAKTTPHMYIIDPKGILVYMGAIDSISSAKVADIGKATNYVRNTFAQLASGNPVEPNVTKAYGCSIKY